MTFDCPEICQIGGGEVVGSYLSAIQTHIDSQVKTEGEPLALEALEVEVKSDPTCGVGFKIYTEEE